MDSIIPGKDYFVEVLVQQTTDPAAPYTPASGRTDVRVWFSDTEGGPAIAPALDLTGFAESGTKTLDDGSVWARYLATLAGASTTTPLGDRAGLVIFRNEQVGTQDASSRPLRVRRR